MEINLSLRDEKENPAREGPEHAKVTGSSWFQAFIFLLLTFAVLFVILWFLQWRRRRIELGGGTSGASANFGNFLSLFQRDAPRRFNWDQSGYDPLSQQQFLFEEELDVELGAYNFEGQVPSSIRETKLRSSELRNSLADDGGYPPGGQRQTNAPFSQTTATDQSGLGNRFSKPVEDEDDADLLQW
ncbi:hypothetical protein HDU67_005873 [Dinochytrium kinnereticum]|nr:hypothetical protein HDU67_005873 [Dinochytrium kinnereticum]